MFAARTNWTLEANAYTVALEQARRAGRQLFDLTASNPTTVGLEYEQERVLQALQHRRALEYEPAAKGLRVAREAVADYYVQHDATVDVEQIVLTVSTSEAYSYCFRLLCNPGDEVLVAWPSYPLFEFLADIQDVKLVPYELVYDQGWQIEFESLTRAITAKTRAILVVHPNNPTGQFAKRWERERLNAICAEHGLALIVDEVFLDYALPNVSCESFAANQEVLTFTLSGLSKIAALPQIKSAWVAASGPQKLVDDALARLEVIADTYLSPNAPVQWAMSELLATGVGVQRQLRERVSRNLSTLDARLAAAQVSSRLAFDAGWYAVLRTVGARSDEQTAVALLEQTGVLVHPGQFFNFADSGYLVVSLITPEEDFQVGATRMLTTLDRFGLD